MKLSSEAKGHMLSLIGQYCPRIKSLKYYPNYESSNEKQLTFFRDNGHKLEELDIFTSIYEMKKFYKICPNLKIFHFSSLSTLAEDPDLLDFFPKKLEQIKLTSRINANDVKKLKIITDKCSQLFKTFDARLDCLRNNSFQTLIDCISRLENLTELRLDFGLWTKKLGPIDKCLPVIGQKCTKLLKLDLIIDSFSVNQSLLISDQFFDCFSNFKGIKKVENNFKIRESIAGKCRVFQTLQTTL